MASKSRTITATTPDGYQVSVNVGPKRQVGAIRILAAKDWDGSGDTGWGSWQGRGQGVKWIVTVHRTLELAVKGSNETTAWNGGERWAIVIDENDQPAGAWVPAPR